MLAGKVIGPTVAAGGDYFGLASRVTEVVALATKGGSIVRPVEVQKVLVVSDGYL